jgi:N-acetylglucosamine-6-sulfatase
LSNVLLVLADDMRQDLLRFMPRVAELLRAEGTEFTNAYCNVPICQAARAGVLTGQEARGAANGVYQNTHLLRSTTNLLPTWFTGVTRAMIGKVPVGYDRVTARPGWDTWRVLASGRAQEAYGYSIHDGSTTIAPSQHQTPYLAGEVESFVTSAPEPFLCWWAPTNPHINTSTYTNNPLPATMDRFSWVRWPFQLLESTDGKPEWIASRPPPTASGLSTLRHAIRQQIREVSDLDDRIGSVIAALDAVGRLEDTYIILVSDSGVFYGEQRLGLNQTASKDQPYDVAAKIPCVVRGPDIPAGSLNISPVNLQDVTSTITSVLGGTPTVPQHGTDLRGFIASPDPTRPILYERQASATFPDAVGVFTATRNQYEAYDLDTDPHELTNWANDEARTDERNDLEAVLNGLLGAP